MIQKILIIEDEKPNADRLQRLISIVRPEISVAGIAESVAETVAWFRNNAGPDLVMMDVRLSDGLSFEIFDKIKIRCPIIFTTAYDEYAVRAFKYNSIDYLLKPVELDELEAAFEKLERITQADVQKSMEGLLNFLKPKTFRNRFLLPYRDGYKTILISDIAYFYSEAKMTRARLYNGSDEILPQTMEELEQQLDPKFFFRANRQFIVHIDSIHQIHNQFNGKLRVILKRAPDVEVIVSREKAVPLKTWMDY